MALAPGQAFTYGLVTNEVLNAIALFRTPGQETHRLTVSFSGTVAAGYRLSLTEDSGALAQWISLPGREFSGYQLLKALVEQASGTVLWSEDNPDQMVLVFP